MSFAHQRRLSSTSLAQAPIERHAPAAAALAFRQPAEGIEHLDPGQEPTLALTFDGACLASNPTAGPDVSSLIRSIYAILELYGVDDDLCGGIIHSMISGEAEGPGEDAISAEEAAVLSEIGHILLPIIDAGVDRRTAARVTDAILDLPIAAELNELKLMREQTSARNLIAQAA